MKTNVRTAKAQLSALLERAAAGEEIVITSDGKPKAKLVAIGPGPEPFRVDRGLLAVRPLRASPRAEAIVRSDRDGRD